MALSHEDLLQYGSSRRSGLKIQRQCPSTSYVCLNIPLSYGGDTTDMRLFSLTTEVSCLFTHVGYNPAFSPKSRPAN